MRVRPLVSAAVLAIALLSGAAHASAATFTHSAVVERDGDPTLLVDGKPFFFYGAAFFYERMPAATWRASMEALAAMGFNTLDLYVPWNWHELADGDFDFAGRTNPQRNLREVLRLGKQLGFHFIVRPGPVIRNEWRNGGYPAWLLERPEYGMPLHDILEGRYPATATLQNANSDDAAAEWMRNTTHMRYASRWLQTALREFELVADRVIAVQLDDDQGAYIDNQTWPAPNFQAYLHELERITRTVTGPQLPAFINTYEMKVTASAPVWAMGNWYQSDAYSIGEHDRASLEFSTGLLQTQTRWPVAISEFQAGWLAAPEDPTPRPADPTNTELALHTLLGLGARGVVDFPAQDTVNPAGWEAPFANASYAWDAALGPGLTASARYDPTRAFGEIVKTYGAQLAGARRRADGAIAYTVSAYAEAATSNADVFAAVARTQAAQQACRAARATCDLVDLRYAPLRTLLRYPFVVVPPRDDNRPMLPSIAAKLEDYKRGGGRVFARVPAIGSPAAGGIPDATVLVNPDGAAFVTIVNYESAPRTVTSARVPRPGGGTWTIATHALGARSAELLRLDAPTDPRVMQNRFAPPQVLAHLEQAGPAAASVRSFTADDGFPRIAFAQRGFSALLSPLAGARLTSLTDADFEAVTSVGALRDDVEVQPPLSTTDRIGKYTRSFPAGMFNRPYRVAAQTAESVSLAYDAPDVVPHGAHFRRTVTLRPGERRITVDQRADFPDGTNQRAVTYSSFWSRDRQTLDDSAAGGVGFYAPAARKVAMMSWRPGDVEDARLIAERTSTVVRLRLARGGTRRCAFAIAPAASLDEARAALRQEESTVAANP